MFKEGSKAPDFRLQNEAGKGVSLQDFLGKRVILDFYPKDDTPGCTKEACGFRDNLKDFAKAKTMVLDVSRDTVASHVRFREKYSLPFSLISDPDSKLAQAYGAWGEKNMYGKTTMGLIRSTFVIGTEEKIYRNVKADGHAEKALADLDEI